MLNFAAKRGSSYQQSVWGSGFKVYTRDALSSGPKPSTQTLEESFAPGEVAASQQRHWLPLSRHQSRLHELGLGLEGLGSRVILKPKLKEFLHHKWCYKSIRFGVSGFRCRA